jgi:hypothetical protein
VSAAARWHLAAALLLGGAAVVIMRPWFSEADFLPLGDFPGYVSVVQFVHDALLRDGRVPRWCSRCFGGTTYFVSSFKEYLAFPLALAVGSLWATKTMFLVAKVLAGLATYAIFARLFRAPGAGLVAGYAYGFGASANHQTEHLDVHVSSVLLPLALLTAVEALRRRRWSWAAGCGVLTACQLATNLVQLPVYAVLSALLLAIRPWRDDPGHEPRPERRPWSTAGVGLAVFLVFGASQLAWLAFDLGNHLLIDPEVAAMQRQVFVEHSPFYLLNRANWLGPWLADHHPPGMEIALLDPERRYLGLVPLGVALLGWLCARRRPSLRRWYLTAGLLFLFQYWMALGSRTLLWQIARTFHWSDAAEERLALGLGLGAAGSLAGAVALAIGRRRSRAAIARLAGLALALFFVSHSLFEMLRRVVPLLDLQRAPGHFFDLAPFSVSLLFGLGLVACRDVLRRPGLGRAAVGLAGLATVVDFWPSTAAYEDGTPLGPLRAIQRAAAELPGEDGTLRLMIVPGQSGLNTMLGMRSEAGLAWTWLPWQAGRHWPAFVTAATLGGPRERELDREPVSDRLLAIGRLRYLLTAFEAPLESAPPWVPRTASGRFGLWEQPDVMPMAAGYRAYMLYVGEPDDGVLAVIPEVFPRNLLVVSGGARLAESSPETIEEAALVFGPVADRESRRLAAGRPHFMLDPERTPPAEWSAFWAARSWPEEPLVAVEYRRPAPEHIVLETDAGPAPATVLVAEGHHPWWRATVDGRPAPVLRAQKTLMAVRVGPGRHVIALRLRRPAAVAAADWTTAAAWIAVLLGGAWAATRRAARSCRSARRPA